MGELKMKTINTFANGSQGAMPDNVVEVILDDQGCRAEVRVLHASGKLLGVINRSDTRGGECKIKAGDKFLIDYHHGLSAIEHLRRETDRANWREVTPESPWWDGRRYVQPITSIA